MVLFDNIKIGQRVEVRWKGLIVPGTVKYKGSLNGMRGEWVGVALDRKVGTHDGMVKGRRYFLCDAQHGIFTLASQIRFISLKRCLYNSYRTTDRESVIEDDLFESCRPTENKYGFVVEGKAEKIRSGRFGADTSPLDREQTYNLRHSASTQIAPATWARPQTAQITSGRDSAWTTSRQERHRSSYHREYENDSNDFIPASTIPMIHMPHSALKRQTQIGWAKAPLVRYWSVHTGRDAVKMSQWNDISA